jgi:hypothetical protein
VNKYLSIVFLACSLFTCTDDDFEEEGKRLLPLQVGNIWKLEPQDTIFFYSLYINMEVTGKTTIAGREYFTIARETRHRHESSTSVSTDYIRIDNRAFVYEYHPSLETELNIARLAAKPDHEWTLYEDVHVRIFETDVELETEDLPNCKGFSTHVHDGGDYGSSQVFARDIGLVLEGYAMAGNSVLTYAKINGVEHHFKK